MKKTGLFLLLTAFGFLWSCSPNNNVTPAALAVVVTPSNPPAKPGDSLNFSVAITDGSTLQSYQANVSVGGGTATQLSTATLTGTSQTLNQGYKVPVGFTGQIIITFIASDVNGASANATATITVASDINSFSQVLLGSYNDPNVGSFYASSTNSVYTVTATESSPATQALVDMVFYYGATNMATLAAPTDNSFGTGSGQISSLQIQSWTNKNNTMFRTTALTSLNGINNAADITNAYNYGGVPGTLANMLSQGNVVAFMTASGKMGLVLIGSITNANASTGLGEMQIQVVVQK